MVEQTRLIKVLEKATAEADGNKAAVGRKIGYSRTAVSLAMAGRYPGKIDKLSQAVFSKLLGETECPYLGDFITDDECKTIQQKPLNDPNQLTRRHRRACAHCIHNKAKEPAHVA